MTHPLQSEIEAELDTFWECAYEIEKAYSNDEYTQQQYLQEKQEAFGASLEKLTTLMISWATSKVPDKRKQVGVWNKEPHFFEAIGYNEAITETLKNIRGGDE